MKKARLTQKFTRIFLCPLLLGILLSITITVFLCVKYTIGLSQSQGIISFIREADQMRTNPILFNVGDIVYKKFQGSFSALLGLKTLYNQFINSNYLNMTNEASMIEFINKYSFNLLNTKTNLNATLTQITNNNNETYLDYSGWYFDNTVNNINDLANLNETQRAVIIKQLYVMTNMNLFLKSNYEINRDDPTLGYLNFYSGFANTGLFNYYPISQDPSFYEPFKSYVNQPSCRRGDNLDILPDYYYFPCRAWYNETLMLGDKGYNMSVTTPYFSPDKTSVLISSCMKMDDLFIFNKDNFIITCVDLDVTDIVSTFDFYNKILNGYFFLIRVFSKYPIYYPSFMKKKYLADLEGLVFDLDTEFYLNELLNFESLTYEIDKLSLNNTETVITGIYLKDGVNNSFTVYPIRLNIDDIDPDNSQHLISVVYITTSDSHLKTLQSIQTDLYPRITFQVFIFIIFGLILMLISRYLVISIANNIVKPMRVMKRLIQGMNNKNTTIIESLSRSSRKYNFLDETDEEYDSDSDDEDERNKAYEQEEDFIETRSQDLELLFSTLIKLKMSLNYSKDTQLTTENGRILNYVFAKYTFNEVKIHKARYICDSNIGNLAIKCKKYDKAIFHLTESLKDPQILKKLTKAHPSNIQLINKRTIKSSHTKSGLNPIMEKNQAIVDALKKNFLDSRYPKLIYAYKKYYSNMRKILKNKTDMGLLLSTDNFTLYEKHSLENFENVLIDFLNMSKQVEEPKKKAEALIEYTEFILKNKIKSTKKFLNEDVKKSKEESIKLVMNNFSALDTLLGHLQCQINNQYIKKFSDIVKLNKKENYELIELPIHVLIQKTNYLKGVFCMYCAEYNQAVNFFNESKKVNIISNAVIVHKSIKKIKKIVTILNTKLNTQIDEVKEVKQRNALYGLIMLSEKRERLMEYNELLANELDKYKLSPKDIAILINYSSKMTKDSKKTNQTLKLTENIFENLVTTEDRFSLFLYCEHTNPYISLEYKNDYTEQYIRDQIKTIFTHNDDEAGYNNESNLIESLLNVYMYLKKKNISNKLREKWIIVITDVLQKNEISFIKEKNIKEELFEGSGLVNVILITLKAKHSWDMADVRNKLSFNKSGIVDFDKLDELRKRMRIYGAINEDVLFHQEKYDNFRK
jgi:hypothetical protein